MAIVQDIYNTGPAIGYPGMVANGETSNRISRTVEDAAGIAFGAPVWAGTGDRGCTATPGTAANFLGFVIADHGEVPLPGGIAADKVAQNRSVAIMASGTIYVPLGPNAVNDRAAVTIGAGGGAADGIGSTAADATHIGTNGWIFDDTTAAGGIARVAKR
jgi:hypothetical protein